MDPRLLEYYNAELAYMRELAQEFAEEHPKIAARFGMNGVEVADPYVERLLQGFSFLTARIQLKMDEQFPDFSHRMLEVHYPNYLAPTPSMAIVALHPDMAHGSLESGFPVPRHSALLAGKPKGEETACEFRSAHDVVLWPLEIVDVGCTGAPPDLPLSGRGFERPVKGAVRIRIKTTKGKLAQLSVDRLPIYVAGDDAIASRLYELVFAHALAVVGCETQRPVKWIELLPPQSIQPEGFDSDQAMLPFPAHSFQGYRQLHEYFACPNRYRFFTLTGLKTLIAKVQGDTLDVAILLDCDVGTLENQVGKEQLALFCTPVINLFPKEETSLEIDAQAHEHHVAPDKTHPLNFEIYAVTNLSGSEESAATEGRKENRKESGKTFEFYPIQSALGSDDSGDKHYFAVRHELRMIADANRRQGQRANYVGCETFVSLVDLNRQPYRHELKSLSVDMLCTNRDLAFLIPKGSAPTDFDMRESVPVESVKLLRGPTEPRQALANGAAAWRFISHLTLNYLTLIDIDPSEGAQALRELLSLYAPLADMSVKKQIEAIRHCSLKAVTRRLPAAGQIAVGRGIGIDLTVDESFFGGVSPYLFGSVMEQFFPRHVGQNSFTETALHSVQRGEIARWKLRMGKRPIA
jgi:type VI secretion system protein ImpG